MGLVVGMKGGVLRCCMKQPIEEVRRVVLGAEERGELRRGKELSSWAGAGERGIARIEGRRSDARMRRGDIVLVVSMQDKCRKRESGILPSKYVCKRKRSDPITFFCA